MSHIIDNLNSEFIESVEKYLNNEITLESLKIQEEKLCFIWEYNRWDEIRKTMKMEIFQLTMKLYNRIGACQRLVDSLEKLNKEEELECELDDIMSRSMMLSRNKASPLGFEASSWYVGPFPTLQMLEALKEEGEE